VVILTHRMDNSQGKIAQLIKPRPLVVEILRHASTATRVLSAPRQEIRATGGRGFRMGKTADTCIDFR